MTTTKQRPLSVRLWEKVDRAGECWEFTGARTAFGHGVIRREHHGPMAGAHRVAWEMAYGPIPAGLFVCHTCDNPSCIRLTHLFLGTAADNNADRDRKGRARYFGHHSGEMNHAAKLTAIQVVAIRSRYAAGGVSQAALGHEYGVSQAVVSAIVLGQAWKGLGL